MEAVDCIVVGAGVIGLAVGRHMAMAGRDTLILERNAGIGEETSARNSEVIHAGLYYPADSLKARLCVAGRHLLYRYCEERTIPHRRCGKLVVARHQGEAGQLEKLRQSAERNGVDDLAWLDGSSARHLEPELACHAALWSPSTGILDSRALMLALLADAESHGATLVTRTRVSRVTRDDGGFAVWMEGEAEAIRARTLVNAAGHGAVALAAGVPGIRQERLPRARLAKGSYFLYSGRVPFQRLVYPLPEHDGLGVHLTLDLAGAARFGPDVEWVEAADYSVDPARAADFAVSIRQYWPGIDPSRLRPGYAGLRPKISGPSEPAADFRIDGPAIHGVDGLVNLLGMESPGLTSCLAVAAEVERRLVS